MFNYSVIMKKTNRENNDMKDPDYRPLIRLCMIVAFLNIVLFMMLLYFSFGSPDVGMIVFTVLSTMIVDAWLVIKSYQITRRWHD